MDSVLAEIRALGKILAEQAVGVLVATLPRALRVAEVDLEIGIDPQLRVLGLLLPIVVQKRARAMTIVETARLNDVDPQAYLVDILDRIHDHKINRLDDLLPWNWAP